MVASSDLVDGVDQSRRVIISDEEVYSALGVFTLPGKVLHILVKFPGKQIVLVEVGLHLICFHIKITSQN